MTKITLKKIAAFVLAVIMLVGLIPQMQIFTIAQAATTTGITRAEWIHNLADTFEIAVDETDCPDNYYADIDDSTTYYEDIMKAVAYGVVDIEAGKSFEPDKPATREFAAHTLNFCLGFQTEGSTYSFTDSGSCTYPADAQVAVNRGWFALSNQKFLPSAQITSTEMQKMINDAKAILNKTEVSENYDSTWNIASGVKEITAGTEVMIDGNQVKIQDCSTAINKGDTFVVYQGEIAVPFKATNVIKVGNITTITTEDVQDYNDAFAKVDAEGVIESDELTYEALDGTELEVETREKTEVQSKARAARATKKIKDAKFSKSFKLSGNLSSSIQGTFKNIKVKYNVATGPGETFVQIEGDLSMTGSIAATAGASINIMKIGVPGVGGVTLTADLKAEGKLNSTITSHVVAGLSYSRAGGFRTIRSFKENGGSNTSTEATATMGATLKCGITDMKVISGYVYGKAGVKAQIVDTTWENGQPRNCKTFLAYMYASYGAEASCKFVNYKYSNNVDIYNLSNSPMRIYHHYEDGRQVAQCSRGLTFDYFTKYYSSYWGSGWSGCNSSYGLDGEGKPYAVYEYSLKENEKGEQEATITKYHGNMRNLVIPETLDGYHVKKVGNNAFSKNNYLRIITMPNCISEIEANAFSECSNLFKVTLSNELIKMGNNAFYNCDNITEIQIPKSLEYCDDNDFADYGGPFNNCDKLKNITFEEGTTRVAARLFSRCTGVEEIQLPDTIKTIDWRAFLYCSNLRKIAIPDKLTKIDGYAFKGCTNLEEIIIPDTVTEIGENAFENCSKISKVVLPKNIKAMRQNAFLNCDNITEIEIPKSLEYCDDNDFADYGGPFNNCDKLKKVTFENGTTRVAARLFSRCTGLEEITLPDTIKTIDWRAFLYCSNLKEVNFSNNLIKIDGYAFAGCTNLEKIIIPDTVTEIGENAFKNCGKINDLVLSKSIKKMGNNVFYNCDNISEVEIPRSLEYCDDNDFADYGGPFNDCDNLKKVTFEEGITRVAARLFSRCTGLEEITLPNTIKTIDWRAFLYCSNLRKIVIPDGVTKIEGYAFRGCTSLNEVSLPNSVVEVKECVFSNCENLSKASLSDNLISVGDDLFSNCKELKNIKLSVQMNYIPRKMFYNCTSLKNIKLPDTVTYIRECAFENSGLESIKMSPNVTTIENYAFKNTPLKSVEFSGKEETIGREVFKNCDALTSVKVPDSVTSIGSGIFQDCDALTTVSLGTGITLIPTYAFEHCDALANIVIPYKVTKIDNNAFANNVAFTEITIPRATTTIADSAFSYPSRTTVNGIAGTYAETFANEQGMKFVNKEIKATNVKLSESNVTIHKNAKKQLQISIVPDNFTDVVNWKSTNTDIVTVDNNGLITAKGIGTAAIKVTVGNVSATCNVKVVQPVTSIYLNESSLTLDGGDSYKLTAEVYPNDADNKSVEWSSSDKNVATVDSEGNVKALSKGIATITAMSKDGSGVSRTCKVTVRSIVHNITDITSMQSAHPYENNCADSWVYTVSGAEALSLTFDTQTEIEDGFDYLYIYDMDNNQIGCYTGTQLAGKIITLKGNKVRIKLEADEGGSAYGFKINEIKAVSGGDVTSSDVTPTEKPTVADIGKNDGSKSNSPKPIVTKIQKVKKSKKSLKITWIKKKGVSGYQIQCATNKKFKKAKKFVVKGNKKTSKTIKKLKAKKKYYLRIRTYKVVNGKKVYSSWSKVKVQRTK